MVEVSKAMKEALIDLAAELLEESTGLDVTSEHGAHSPTRFVEMLLELTTPEPFNFTTFENLEGVDEMITISPIPFYTLCEHHIIPFFGTAHIAYVPSNRLAGLSKFARVVKSLSRGLWVQEHLTKEIADFLEAQLAPLGVAVVMRAEHLCMTMRGVQTPGAITTTSAVRGVFADHSRTAKAEFFATIKER
jgi:GTP cyclohydrolase IA